MPYRGEGWDAVDQDAVDGTSAIWATATESRLFLPLRQVDPEATYTITMRVRPFSYAGSPQQTVDIAVNQWVGDRPNWLTGGMSWRGRCPARYW
ncbi:MAG: hypothetical protein R2867_04875 [Caldilineaceae bacterium]